MGNSQEERDKILEEDMGHSEVTSVELWGGLPGHSQGYHHSDLSTAGSQVL